MNELAANPGPLVSYGLLVIILIVAINATIKMMTSREERSDGKEG